MTTKPKRKKTWFKNYSELAHVWAQFTQPEGNAGKMFFRDTNKVYSSYISYGHHYCIAERHTAKDGRTPVILVNSNGYSPTTGRHTSEVVGAISHLKSFHVPDNSDPLAPENKNELLDRVINRFEGLMLKRSGFYSTYKESGQDNCYARHFFYEAVETFNDYCATFGIKDRIDIGADLRAEIDEVCAYRAERERVADETRLANRAAFRNLTVEEQTRIECERAAKRDAAALRKFNSQIEAWKGGAGPASLHAVPNSVVLLRIKGDILETSRGARVPLDEARALYASLKTGRDIAKKPIGHYRINSVGSTHVIIGCHTVPIEEIRRVLDPRASETDIALEKATNVIELRKGA